METGSEWSQNKKVVNVTRKDGVAKAVSFKQKLFLNKIILKWYGLTITNSKLMSKGGKSQKPGTAQYYEVVRILIAVMS